MRSSVLTCPCVPWSKNRFNPQPLISSKKLLALNFQRLALTINSRKIEIPEKVKTKIVLPSRSWKLGKRIAVIPKQSAIDTEVTSKTDEVGGLFLFTKKFTIQSPNVEQQQLKNYDCKDKSFDFKMKSNGTTRNQLVHYDFRAIICKLFPCKNLSRFPCIKL